MLTLFSANNLQVDSPGEACTSLPPLAFHTCTLSVDVTLTSSLEALLLQDDFPSDSSIVTPIDRWLHSQLVGNCDLYNII